MTAEIPVNNIVVVTKTTYINGVPGLPSNRSGSVLSKFDGSEEKASAILETNLYSETYLDW